MTDPAASWTVVTQDSATVLRLSGPLDARGAGRIWRAVLREAGRAKGRTLQVDMTALTRCDTAGATLLLEIERAHGAPLVLLGASERATAVLALARAATALPVPAEARHGGTWREAFMGGVAVATDAVAFLGEMAVAVVRVPRRARMLRIDDVMRAADQAGLQAIPLVLLLGVLIGLILAFQSLIPMRQYGADIYVANLVAISLVRELGPLLAAVILSGRSGSAFAAEIGTMKVNQELDALATMGVDAMTMLVLPRLIAAVAVMPVLAVIMDLAGMLGMALVLVGSGIPPIAIADQVARWVVPTDLYGGLAKAAVFGAAIAAIGCRAGLSTGVGPRAVGSSATAAVVGGIVATMALDGVFAVAFYKLGW